MSLAAKHGVPKLGLRRTGAVLRVVGHHLWPKGETGLRCRVVVAMVLLIVAKVTNVYVPVLYKHAVDALGEPTAQAVAVPVALILAYGVARVLAQAFGELRDAIFAPVVAARDPQHRPGGVPPPPCAVAALPSRAPDRRARAASSSAAPAAWSS